MQSSNLLKFDDSINNALGTGDINTYTVSLQSVSDPLVVTLVWREPAGDTIQNRIHLRVVHVPSGNISSSENENDVRNNVHRVIIKNPIEQPPCSYY